MQSTNQVLASPMNFISKSEYVYRSIRTAILNGIIKPGSFLNQAELAEQFQVSRMPIRDAINMLAKEGLVRIMLHKGAKVAHFSPKDIQEIYAIRRILEGYAVREATVHITKELLAKLEEINRNISKNAQNGDADSMIKENERFHRALYEPSDNKRLIEMIENLWVSCPKRIFWEIQGRARQVVEQHRAILVAVRSQNPAKAEKMVHNNLIFPSEILNTIPKTFDDLRFLENQNKCALEKKRKGKKG